ncbi:regulatory protein [[Actinomadura] parvosata subsp. kistnae]|uniref:Transcriptional regulator n=1 Tax=[Actinomadura] parvosata subsp. kistnae TaxID=1909395 RepID=A0A1V0AE09_9ACTN|nr:helix-turn-helix domain-containing protein [Nonomuraea sp. ATCC 55076]AQZ68460.1 transcriptional regulator [Nonomuraea sp. ATCC 55076]SPL93092.1 regulatory protein [Actinomadura parvosata subsp. kistnae]
MLEQPVFGRRLRQLRTERGLTLAALAGEGMSTGYLSRLESGARQPTERAVAYLAEQLGISPAELTQSTGTSLAQSLTLATGFGQDEAAQTLSEALKASEGEDPLLRWQALWQVAEWHGRRQEYTEQRACLDELAELSTRIGLPELQARVLAELSRCLRSTGEITGAVDTATRAYELTRSEELPARVRTATLIALVSALAEAGRVPDAAPYTDELLTLTEQGSGPQWAQALWTVASLRIRQGEVDTAGKLMDQAIAGFDGRDDLTLWMRLRISSARLALLTDPPHTEIAQQRVEEVQAALPFGGTPTVEQQLLALRARLAVITGRPAEARAMLEQLAGFDDLLTFQDRIRLDVLRNRVLLLEGKQEPALDGLRKLAEQAQQSGNMDLAAEIWRLIAESLAK